MARSALLNVVTVAASAFGVVALWLPFTWGISPLEAFPLAVELEGLDVFELLAIAAPSLLALPIALWNLARYVRPEPSAAERTVAYTLSSLAMLALVVVTALVIVDGDLSDLQMYFALAAGWLALAATAVLWTRMRKRGVAAGTLAEVYLLLGYLPGMAFALIGFAERGFILRSPDSLWDIGGFVVVATCGLYVAQAVLRLRSIPAPGLT